MSGDHWSSDGGGGSGRHSFITASMDTCCRYHHQSDHEENRHHHRWSSSTPFREWTTMLLPHRARWSQTVSITMSAVLLLMLLFISSAIATADSSTGHQPYQQSSHYLRRLQSHQPQQHLVSTGSAFGSVGNSKRHLPAPSSAAEYFYANDKLADDQVANFVSSLGHANGSNPYQTTSPRSSSSSSASSQQSRVSSGHQNSASSLVFPPPSPRISLPVAQSASSSSSSSSHHQSELLPNSGASSNYQNKQQSSSSVNYNSNNPQSSNRSNLSIRSNAEFSDLSWLQPVYVSPKLNVSRDQKLQLNAFRADSSDSGSPSTANRTMTLNEDAAKLPSPPLSTTPPTTSSDRLDRLSAALANVTFSLRDEQWVAPIIALSLLNIMVIVGFECFVIYRACRTCPSRRHLFLGQMLLLGLFLSSVMGLAFVPDSNWLTCTFIRAGVGICYAIVYGTLLVKTVFLLSLHTGVYLSAEYQALLLFFIISTQVAIDAQWLVHRASSTVIDYMDGYGHAVYKCDHSLNHLFMSLIYVMILIGLIVIMAFRVRGYRENHGEAMFIGITATCTVVLWLVWIAGSLTSTPHYRDGFTAFGLVGNATLIFVIMFLPKGRQLAAVGRGHGLDDRDQLSTASSPSIYTPSFLQFKPVGLGLTPLGKPSIAGLSSVGVGSGMSGPGGYHLYKQFQGTGTTLTSPISTVAPPGPLSGGQAIPNSYSSHAIFPSAMNKSHNTPLDHHHSDDDDHNDPNYSNLSTIFATSTSHQQQQLLNASKNQHSNLNSPISEHNSTSNSSSNSSNSKSSRGDGSKSGGSKTSGQSKNSKSTSNNSAASHQQMIKSPVSSSNAADCFFYLQPPPLPPPSSRPPQPPVSQAQQQRDSNSRNQGAGAPWRQTCFTPNYHRSHHQASVGMHHYPKSLAGLNSHHPFHGGAVSTPLGPPPSGPNSLHHHLLSPSSDCNETTTSFYFASFDAAGGGNAASRQLLSNSASNGAIHGSNSNHNFKYFRGQLY